MKVIIAGGRDFHNYAVMEMMLDQLFADYEPHEITVISGRAKGADLLGERYADSRGIEKMLFPVTNDDWNRYGSSAGHRRNAEMAEHADTVVAFFDGSKGTAGMINIAKRKKLTLVVYDYEGNEIERVD